MIADLLLSDPTFALMTPAERRVEAVELMKTAGLGDDELEAALHVEEAEARHARGENLAVQAQEVLPAGIEPCREDKASCASPVAATGRCMECGARRVSLTPYTGETITQTLSREMEGIGGDVMISVRTTTDPNAPLIAVGKPATANPSPNFLARFKGATGLKDVEIADVLGRARSSVQAQVSGRLADNLTAEDADRLAGALEDRVKRLTALLEELGRR